MAKSVIAAAIEEWTSKTCLQFEERTSERAGLCLILVKLIYINLIV